jgi:hypothetical protein
VHLPHLKFEALQEYRYSHENLHNLLNLINAKGSRGSCERGQKDACLGEKKKGNMNIYNNNQSLFSLDKIKDFNCGCYL